MKEIKRVTHKNIEFRLVDKPQIRKIGDKKYRYRWIIQARPPGKFRFDDFYIIHRKSIALKYMKDEKELDRMVVGFRAIRLAMNAVNKLGIL